MFALCFIQICYSGPVQSFDNNIKFVCQGEKCFGLDFSIRYPSTWKSLDTDRPHVVCKVFSENGKGMEGLVLTVFNDARFQNSDLQDIAKANMNKNSKVIKYSNDLNIDDCESVSLCFESEDKRLDMIIYSQSIVYVLRYKQYIFCFNFTVADTKEKSKVSARFDEYLPLFKKMILSFTIQSKYKK
jgi:hypothetical protein